MNCEAATNFISSLIDGEISSVDQAALDEHLAACPSCRATLEALRAQDSHLNNVFAPRRAAASAVAERVIEQIHREHVGSFRPRRFGFLNTLLAAAAGFAIALLIFQPWKKPPVGNGGSYATTQPTPGVAHLALATGTIEILPPNEKDWQIMPTGASIAPGSRIRTSDKVRCELVMADDSTIRLDSNTQVLVGSSRHLDLTSGQMWSSITPAAAFTISVAQASITAVGTEFDLAADPVKNDATLTVLDGSTKVVGQGGERVIESGKKVRIANGTAGDPQVADLITTTNWVNELLMMKGRDNAELRKRIDSILAIIGNEKMGYMYEDEIRALGDHCVLPLTRYVQSPLSAGDPAKRHAAARILTEMAQPWAIPELIELLKDNDGEVRFYAARALQRLVRNGMGRTPEQWRAQMQRDTYNEWTEWWVKNKERYPASPLSPSPLPGERPMMKAKS
jgi:ferric-dicitrate binding protein FerR (iron transport regulator)